MVVKFLGLEEGKGGKVGKVKRWKRVRRRKMLKGKSLKCLKLSEEVSYLLVFQARTIEAGVVLGVHLRLRTRYKRARVLGVD